MSQFRYAVYPCWVTSRTDGDRHFIGAVQLIGLYGVRAEECLVIPAERGSLRSRESRERDDLIRYVEANNLITLAPRHDGDYRLPGP